MQCFETADKALGKRAFPLVERDEAGLPDRRRGRTFPRSGLTEEHRREILHTVPQVALVKADIFGEHVGPEMPPQLLHRLAPSHQSPFYEEVCPADLVEHGKVEPRFLGRETTLHEQPESVAGKGNWNRTPPGPHLR